MNNLKKAYAYIEEKRLDGKTWLEVTNDLNRMYGVWFSESKWRKPYQAYKQGREDKRDATDTAYELQRIRVKRKELAIERSVNNEQIRDISLHNTYVNQLCESVSSLPSLNIGKKIKKRKSKEELDVSATNGKEVTSLVFLADLHYTGEKDKFLNIINNVGNILIDYIEENDLNEIQIVELGDVIEGGSLRVSQLMGIKRGMVRQIIEASEIYAQMLAEVINETGCKIVFRTVTSSNHTQLRPLGTKRNELMDEDLMRVFLNHLKTRFADSEDEIEISGSDELQFSIQGYNVYCAHGHVGNMSPSNMSKVIYENDFYRKVKSDYFIFGHYHHYHEESLNTTSNKNKKGFLMPSLTSHISSYEKNLRLGSVGEITVLSFESSKGHTKTEHLKVEG